MLSGDCATRPQRMVLIDARPAIDVVHGEIVRVVEEKLMR